jgi:asparagine synthase (glutamine-hydrolysing)
MRRAGGRVLHRLADVSSPRPTIERHLDWVTGGRRHLRRDVYGERLSDRAQGAAALETLRPHFPGDEGANADGLMRLDQLHWLPDDVLAVADRAGMLASLEMRTPFLTRELAGLAASVPQHGHDGPGGKALLRHALRTFVPRTLTWRRKVAFRVPGAEWLRGPLAPVFEEQLRDGRLFSDGWFSAEAVRPLLAAHRAGGDHTATLWPLLTLGLWLDEHAP